MSQTGPTASTPRYLPVARAARAVGRSEQTLRNWLRRRYITAYAHPARRGLLVDIDEVRRVIRTSSPQKIRPRYGNRQPVRPIPVGVR